MRQKMKERQAPADVTGPRYRKAGRKDKKKIPGEFCQNTDYHRKYAIALLRNAGKTQLRRIGKETVRVKITAEARVKRTYTRVYDEEVERADIPEDIKRALQKKKDSPDIIALQEALNTAPYCLKIKPSRKSGCPITKNLAKNYNGPTRR